MNRTTRWSVVSLLVGFKVFLSGSNCKDRANNTKPLVLKPVSFTKLRFVTPWTWRHSAHAHYVIRNASEWQRMWRQGHYSMQVGVPPTPPSSPPVDFKSKMILAVFQGHCSSGGYGVTITDVGETNEQLTVVVKYREPGPNETTTAAETSPFCMVSVPRSEKPVDFRIVEVTGSP